MATPFDDFGRSYWRVETIQTRYEDYEERVRVERGKANLVGSQVRGRWHAPALDIDLPAHLEPLDGAPGHSLLMIDVACSRVAAARLRRCLSSLGMALPGDPLLSGMPFRFGAILKVPVQLVPSSTESHYHLYLNHLVTWRQYRRLLKALWQCGLIEKGFYRLSRKRSQSFLRPPGVTKAIAGEQSSPALVG